MLFPLQNHRMSLEEPRLELAEVLTRYGLRMNRQLHVT